MISQHDACILVVNYAWPVVIKVGFLLESSPESKYSSEPRPVRKTTNQKLNQKHGRVQLSRAGYGHERMNPISFSGDLMPAS